MVQKYIRMIMHIILLLRLSHSLDYFVEDFITTEPQRAQRFDELNSPCVLDDLC